MEEVCQGFVAAQDCCHGRGPRTNSHLLPQLRHRRPMHLTALRIDLIVTPNLHLYRIDGIHSQLRVDNVHRCFANNSAAHVKAHIR